MSITRYAKILICINFLEVPTRKQAFKEAKKIFKKRNRRVKFERKYQKYLQKHLMQSAKFFEERGLM